MSDGALQLYHGLYQAPRAWHTYVQKVIDDLQLSDEDRDDFFLELCESLSDELGYSSACNDFPVRLETVLYQKSFHLAGSTISSIDSKILFQMWLYFRLRDPVALREYPFTGALINEFTASPETLGLYAEMYQQFMLPLFRMLILTKAYEKQLFFVIIDGQTRDHFMIRSRADFLEVYEIESDIGLEMNEPASSESNIDKKLYTIFSSQSGVSGLSSG
jgi:hypothetical protein